MYIQLQSTKNTKKKHKKINPSQKPNNSYNPNTISYSILYSHQHHSDPSSY